MTLSHNDVDRAMLCRSLIHKSLKEIEPYKIKELLIEIEEKLTLLMDSIELNYKPNGTWRDVEAMKRGGL